MRAGELGRIFTRLLANYAHSSIVMLQNPDISLKKGLIEFGRTKFCIIGPKQAFLINIPAGEADIDPLDLFFGNFNVREIRLNAPSLAPIAPDSIPDPWDISFAEENSPARATVQRLLIQKGEFYWQRGSRSARLEQINLSAVLGAQQEIELKGDFLLKAQASCAVSGNLAFRSKIHYYSPNLTLRHTAISFTPLEWPLPIPAGPLRLAFDGALNPQTSLLRMADCNLDWPDGSLTLKGAARLDTGSISAEFFLEDFLTEAEREAGTKSLRLQGFLERQSGDLRLEEMTIQAGDITGSGELSLAFSGEKPVLGGKIDLGKITFGDLPVLLRIFRQGAATAAWPRIDLRVLGAAIEGNGFELRKPAFMLVGERGKYDLKNLTFTAANGRIGGIVQLDLTDNSWRMEANGKKIALARLDVPICKDARARGTVNFQLKAGGTDAEKPNFGLKSDFNLEFDNFQCRPAQGFMDILDDNARKIFASTFALDKFSGKLSLGGYNQGKLEVVRAQNGTMNAEGIITFTLKPFTLDGKMVVHNQNGNMGLDFFWPRMYSPAIQ